MVLTGYVIQNYKTKEFIGYDNKTRRAVLTKLRPRIYSNLKQCARAVKLIEYNNLIIKKITMEVSNV